MPLTVKRLTPWLLTALLLLVSGLALAQAPHPFGVPERTLNTPSIGWFSEWTGQIAIWQSQFYRQLTTAVRVWRDDGFQAWWLLALSFGYGVFHALGPGHGKMVLSAYVLANRETLRNGALLAFISSLVQALVAIALVGIAAGILNVTGAVLNEVTALLELGAYAVLILLGAWLVFKYTLSPLKTVIMGRSRALAVHAGHGDHHGHHHGGTIIMTTNITATMRIAGIPTCRIPTKWRVSSTLKRRGVRFWPLACVPVQAPSWCWCLHCRSSSF